MRKITEEDSPPPKLAEGTISLLNPKEDDIIVVSVDADWTYDQIKLYEVYLQDNLRELGVSNPVLMLPKIAITLVGKRPDPCTLISGLGLSRDDKPVLSPVRDNRSTDNILGWELCLRGVRLAWIPVAYNTGTRKAVSSSKP